MKEIKKDGFQIHYNKWWWGETAHIVRNDGKGFVRVEFQDPYNFGYISDLSVIEDARRKGYARELIEIAHELITANGYKTAVLDVEPENASENLPFGDMGYEMYNSEGKTYTLLKRL